MGRGGALEERLLREVGMEAPFLAIDKGEDKEER